MLVDEKLMEVIVCPKCKAKLTINEEESCLNCLSCNLSYPVKDGIPFLLPDKAVSIKKFQ